MEYLHLKQDMQFFNFEYQFTFVRFFLSRIQSEFCLPKDIFKGNT